MTTTPNSAITPQTVVSGHAKCTAANSNYAAPTAAVLLLASQTNGARLTSIKALAMATVTATELQLYTSPDSGTTFRFVDSALMAAYTVAQTTAQTKIDFGYSDSIPLFLQAGESLYCAIGVALATGIEFRTQGGAY